MELSQADRNALKAIGVTNCTIVEERIQGRYTNRLLRGRSEYGDTLFGTWHDGESAADIKWTPDKRNA